MKKVRLVKKIILIYDDDYEHTIDLLFHIEK